MNETQRALLRDCELLLRQGEEKLARVRRLVEAIRDEETVGDEPFDRALSKALGWLNDGRG